MVKEDQRTRGFRLRKSNFTRDLGWKPPVETGGRKPWVGRRVYFVGGLSNYLKEDDGSRSDELGLIQVTKTVQVQLISHKKEIREKFDSFVQAHFF